MLDSLSKTRYRLFHYRIPRLGSFHGQARRRGAALEEVDVDVEQLVEASGREKTDSFGCC